MSGFDGHLIVTKLAKRELEQGRRLKGVRVIAKNGEKYSTMMTARFRIIGV
jgi:hypothetical protein